MKSIKSIEVTNQAEIRLMFGEMQTEIARLGTADITVYTPHTIVCFDADAVRVTSDSIVIRAEMLNTVQFKQANVSSIERRAGTTERMVKDSVAVYTVKMEGWGV